MDWQTYGANVKVKQLDTIAVSMSNISDLDDISLFIEYESSQRAKLTIVCSESAWGAVWNLDARNILQYLSRCNVNFLTSILSNESNVAGENYKRVKSIVTALQLGLQSVNK
jgi:hypothetical protein